MLDGGGTALVLTLRVEHATTLEKVIAAQGYETMLLVGSDPQRIKRGKPRMFGQLATGKLFAIVATGSYVGEGFDDDRLDALFLAGPVSWRARGAVRGTPPTTARGEERGRRVRLRRRQRADARPYERQALEGVRRARLRTELGDRRGRRAR